MSSNIINPTGGNGTAVITLTGVQSSHALRIQTIAFIFGRSGVGHVFYNPARLSEDGNVRVWRKAMPGDPGQPLGWKELAPFTDGGLADHISALCEQNAGSGFMEQALVFQSVDEGLAFQAAIGGAA